MDAKKDKHKQSCESYHVCIDLAYISRERDDLSRNKHLQAAFYCCESEGRGNARAGARGEGQGSGGEGKKVCVEVRGKEVCLCIHLKVLGACER